VRREGDRFVPASEISIVIPAFRAAATLRRTVESCLPYVPPRQIIVVLDGPDRDMEQAALSCAPGVRVFMTPRCHGAPFCRNYGLTLTETRYVMFLDADDYIEGDLLPSAVAAAEACGADVALGRFSFEFPNGERLTQEPRRLYGDLHRGAILRKWLIGDYTPPCAVIWRTAFVRDLGGWDEALAKNQDGDLIYRALLAGARATHAPGGQGVYVQDDNPGRITRRHDRRTLTSQFRVLEKVRAALPGQPFEAGTELSLAYYSLARLAFTVGVDDIGERSEDLARGLGLSGQPGTTAHNLVASMLGLRGKQKLSALVKRSIAR
jgi:glycosyltransferase involved in cell wall biosynthesis